MKNFIEFMEESQYKSDYSQRGNTGGTYFKTALKAGREGWVKPGDSILSLGAGGSHTSEALRKGLGSRHRKTVIHDMEPNPEGRSSPPKYTRGEDIPSNSYHMVVCHNVANVLPARDRRQLYSTAFRSVKEGGHIIIGARKWSGDVALIKTGKDGPEPKSKIIPLPGGKNGFQRGFDGTELGDDILSLAKKEGHKVEIQRLPGIAATSVLVRMIKKNEKI